MKFSRREILATLLGAPVALAACRRRTRPNISGQIVGAAERFGHRLRESRAFELGGDAGTPERVGVAIVGGGPSGLGAAWRLRRGGFDDFVVLDLEDGAGGAARGGANRVAEFPWGTHALEVPSPDSRALIRLLREMNVVTQVDPVGTPAIEPRRLVSRGASRVFADGQWHAGLYPRDGATADDLRQLDTFRREIARWTAFRDASGRPAFARPIRSSSVDAAATALDIASMSDWMDAKGFVSARLRWLVDRVCRERCGLRMSDASAWAALFALTTCIGLDMDPAPRIVWNDGAGAIVRHVLDAIGPRVRTRELVVDVRLAPDGGVLVRSIDPQGTAHVLHAEHAIVAVPTFVARRVVAPWREHTPPGIDRFTYAPWLVANLTLREAPNPLARENALYDGPSLGYVCTSPPARIGAPAVLTYYLPLTGGDPAAERSRLLAADWPTLRDGVLTDLERAHADIAERTERLDIYRYGHAMVRPVPGFVWGGARMAAGATVGGRIVFAQSDLSGIARFDEAHDRGVVAAEAVLRQHMAQVETFV